MGDFWAESIRLASLATERFYAKKRHLGQGKSRLSKIHKKPKKKEKNCDFRGGGVFEKSTWFSKMSQNLSTWLMNDPYV